MMCYFLLSFYHLEESLHYLSMHLSHFVVHLNNVMLGLSDFWVVQRNLVQAHDDF